MPVGVAGLAYSLIETGIGAANKNQAKAEAENLKRTRPNYGISPEATDELRLAESELQQGLSARAARAYETQVDKGLAGSLSAILKGGGNINSIGDLYGNSEDGRLRLAMLNENNRLSKIQNVISAQRNMTEQRDKSFMYNEDQWWKNDAQNNANAKQNADQQFQTGLSGIFSNVSQIGENLYENKQMDKYLNPEKYQKNGKVIPQQNGTQFGNMPVVNAYGNYDPYSGQDFYQYSGNNNYGTVG